MSRILEETGLDPRLLEMELTESVLIDSVSSAAEMLREPKAMGLRLTIDDFGTGYSSLSYLMQFPIDALKVDQVFVREIASEADTSPIITAVIAMGRSLKQRVIAEGVEPRQQLAFLRAQQCEEAQGFHFSRPLPADRFAALLDEDPFSTKGFRDPRERRRRHAARPGRPAAQIVSTAPSHWACCVLDLKACAVFTTRVSAFRFIGNRSMFRLAGPEM